ncbi:effector-associated domain EAD1-containing protein [Nocardia sp. NPDC023988]|uniref:effector-associated domain EAD1-containing protein n=1 Tax=unclassified Nocardia TaxID=2637762 RepID=UPI003411D63C
MNDFGKSDQRVDQRGAATPWDIEGEDWSALCRVLCAQYGTEIRRRQLAVQLGFPDGELPYATTPMDFWQEFRLSAEGGVVDWGFRELLSAVAARFPYNSDVIRLQARYGGAARSSGAEGRRERPARGSRSDRGFKVMVLGAEPGERSPVGVQAEMREIRAALPPHWDLVLCTATAPSDLVVLRREQPDILHLACHGGGGVLLLENADGLSHQLPAEDLAETLRLAADFHGHRLRAILLRSCESSEVAELFVGLADVVIAHRGQLDAGCSALFAGAFYRELVEAADMDVRTLRSVARIAAQDTVNTADLCRSVRTDLIVLPEEVSAMEVTE